MPKLSLEVPHTLGREEAERRLKQQFDLHSGKVTDLHAAWADHTLTFDFQTMGIKVAGTLVVEETAVRVNLELPFMAMMFKGMIEQRFREEVSAVLK